jgi:hypothetical protein
MSDVTPDRLARNVLNIDDHAVEREIHKPEDLAERWLLRQWKHGKWASFVHDTQGAFAVSEEEHGFIDPKRVGLHYLTRAPYRGKIWRYVPFGGTLTFAGIEDVRAQLELEVAEHDCAYDPTNLGHRYNVMSGLLGAMVAGVAVAGVLAFIFAVAAAKSDPAEVEAFGLTSMVIACAATWAISSVVAFAAGKIEDTLMRRRREKMKPARDIIVQLLDTLDKRVPRTDPS